METTGSELDDMPLQTMADTIVRHANAADEQLIQAARMLVRLRERIQRGEGDGLTWHEWARKNLKLGRSRVHELEAIGEAEDPAEALEKRRTATRERVQRCREAESRRKRALEPDRRILIEFAQEAPIDQVSRLARQAESLQRCVASDTTAAA